MWGAPTGHTGCLQPTNSARDIKSKTLLDSAVNYVFTICRRGKQLSLYSVNWADINRNMGFICHSSQSENRWDQCWNLTNGPWTQSLLSVDWTGLHKYKAKRSGSCPEHQAEDQEQEGWQKTRILENHGRSSWKVRKQWGLLNSLNSGWSGTARWFAQTRAFLHLPSKTFLKKVFAKTSWFPI